jgi:hypothetical protein
MTPAATGHRALRPRAIKVTCGRPKHRHVARLSEQKKAQTRSQKVGNADGRSKAIEASKGCLEQKFFESRLRTCRERTLHRWDASASHRISMIGVRG